MWYDSLLRIISDDDIASKQIYHSLTTNKEFPASLLDKGGATLQGGVRTLLYRLVRNLSLNHLSEIQDSGVISYAKVVIHPILCAIVANLIEKLSGIVAVPNSEVKDSIAGYVQTSVCLEAYRTFGFQRYQISEGLSHELNETSFGDVMCEDVRLPYPCFSVDLPNSMQQLRTVLDTNQKTTPITPLALLVYEDPLSPKGWSEPSTLETADVRTTTPNELIDTVRAFHMTLFAKINNGESDDLVISPTVFKVPNGTTIESATDVCGDELKPITRWLVKVLLYATWPDAILEQSWVDPRAEKLWRAAKSAVSKSQARKLFRKLKEHHPMGRVNRLGGNILVDRTLPAYGQRSEGGGRKLEIRIRVSGHMKRQICGPKHSERKVIWIRPYWRGPEDGPVKFSSHELVSTFSTKPEEPK